MKELISEAEFGDDPLNSTFNNMRRFAQFGTICRILKNVKNIDGGVLVLLKLKVTLLHGRFHVFLNCTNRIKSLKVLDILILLHHDLSPKLLFEFFNFQSHFGNQFDSTDNNLLKELLRTLERHKC